jgi:hypothetical protein
MLCVCFVLAAALPADGCSGCASLAVLTGTGTVCQRPNSSKAGNCAAAGLSRTRLLCCASGRDNQMVLQDKTGVISATVAPCVKFIET